MSTPFEFLNSRIRIAPGRRVVPGQDYQKFLEAEEILQAAREEAENIKQEAIQAYEARRLEGYRDGIAQVNDEKAAYCFQVAKDFSDVIDGVEERLSSLFPQILRNLLGDLGQELSFTAYISRALQELIAEEKLTLKVHPSRRRLLEDHVEKLQLQNHGGFKFIRVHGDLTLEEDQATIETTSSIVVLDLQKQINLIESYVQHKLMQDEPLSAQLKPGHYRNKSTADLDDNEEKPFRVFE